jgi:hypothetical protein
VKVLKALLWIRFLVAVLFFLSVVAIGVVQPEHGFMKGVEQAFEANLGMTFPLSAQEYGRLFGSMVVVQFILNGILLWALSRRRLVIFRSIAFIHFLSGLTTSLPVIPALVFALSFLKSVRFAPAPISDDSKK